MALTIGPAVCPAKRLRILSQAMFASGTFLGALATYALLRGLLRDELHIGNTIALAVVVTAFGWSSLADSGFKIRVPYIQKQVPEWFRGVFPLPATSLFYGFLLGLGFVT